MYPRFIFLRLDFCGFAFMIDMKGLDQHKLKDLLSYAGSELPFMWF
jgi:hypothetical protein